MRVQFPSLRRPALRGHRLETVEAPPESASRKYLFREEGISKLDGFSVLYLDAEKNLAMMRTTELDGMNGDTLLTSGMEFIFK